MNYEIDKNLSREEIKERKERINLPSCSIPFQKDLIDELLEYENQMVFNQEWGYHDSNCKM
jgi:hypothetical protein